MKTALAAAACGMLIAGAALAQDGTLSLTFETGTSEGAVVLAVYDSEAAWNDGGAPAAEARVEVSDGAAVAVLEGLAPGDYAVRAFHDIDGDGEMGMNPFGIPTEPYAFSNNARGHMGPAGWDAARFTVSGPTAQTIDIR